MGRLMKDLAARPRSIAIGWKTRPVLLCEGRSKSSPVKPET